MLQIAMSDRSGSHHQRAVGNRFSHRLVHFGGRQRGRGAHCGTSIPKRYIVRIHYPEMVGNPKLLMARAAAPMLSGLRTSTRTTRKRANSAGTGKLSLFYGRSYYAMILSPVPLLQKSRMGSQTRCKPSAAGLFTQVCNCKKFVKPRRLRHN